MKPSHPRAFWYATLVTLAAVGVIAGTAYAVVNIPSVTNAFFGYVMPTIIVACLLGAIYASWEVIYDIFLHW